MKLPPYLKFTSAVTAAFLYGGALAWDTPTNLHEDDDALHWDSNAPSYNIYEDGSYIATVHGVNWYAPIFNNSVYQVVAHDHGFDFSQLSLGYLYIDEDDEDDEMEDETELAFEEVELYIELNNTDGDLGVHSFVGGSAWNELKYEDINGRTMMEIKLSGSMAKQGLNELSFESAEPTFDELDPAEFFARFPAGTYDIEGTTIDGEEIEGEAEYSTVLPAPAVVYIGENAITANEGCEDDPANDPAAALNNSGELSIYWDRVTTHHPDLGTSGEVEVDLYQFVMETEDSQLMVDLDADTTSFSVPAALVNSGDNVKIEVVVRGSNHNQVGTEACVQLI